MKLTIEHLAPYLPYGLYFYKKDLHLMQRSKHPHDDLNNEKIIYLHNNSKKGKLLGLRPNINTVITNVGTFKLNESIYYRNTFKSNHWKKDKYLRCLKPILRPLSDLTKEIKHNDKKFVPIDKLDGKSSGVLGGNNLREMINKDTYKSYDFYSLKYATIKKLFEWHFDVFGLIPNNLAIDFNSI